MEHIPMFLMDGNVQNENDDYRPLFFKLENNDDVIKYNEIVSSNKNIIVCDFIHSQLRELIKSRNPSTNIKEEEYPALVEKHLAGKDIRIYGIWVYYPWTGNMVHMLDEQEFIEVRTNRNKHKITDAEQRTLSTKKIGIIGLSVGQSIALTLAMERGCGEIRLADFDTLDLSNLNRIRSGVQNIGRKKTIIAAREIAEIDPFIKVTCYHEGITETNINSFLQDGGKLDLLVDECDSLDVKILCRIKARELQIPVLMDTSDRGMLDIERFDLEPQRPLLHGLAEGLEPKAIAQMPAEARIPLVLKLTSAGQGSMRGKASMLEIGMTITTWPQLASSVVLGGAVSADVSRRLLLGHFTDSGRYYVDLDQIVTNKEKKKPLEYPNPYKPLTKDAVHSIVVANKVGKDSSDISLSAEQLNAIVKAGIAAPSTGNDQPWKWYYHEGVLYLLHDMFRSFSFGDFKNLASYLTFGAVIENVVLEAQHLGIEVITQLFPAGHDSDLVAAFRFTNNTGNNTEAHVHNELSAFIPQRTTNRNLGPKKELPPAVLTDIKDVAESVQGAQLHWLTEQKDIMEAAKIIAACDRMRFMHPEGHHDFVNREMRWTPNDAESTKDGIDIRTLGLATPQMAAMQILKEFEVIDFVRSIKGGKLLEMASVMPIMASSAIGLITMPSRSAEQYIMGGRSYERMWLAAEKHRLAVHPLISPLYFFPRAAQGQEGGLSADNLAELGILRERFKQLFNIQEGLAEVFLFKLADVEKKGPVALRKPVEEMLFTDYTA